MKTLIISCLMLVALGSCKKKDVVKTYAEENPLSTYLTLSGFTQNTLSRINAGNFEFGIKFTPKVKGKINAITFKIPDAATNVRVTIWDATAQTIVRTETIPSVTANTEIKQTIPALMLEKDKMYMITYNGDDWYRHSKTDDGSVTYPFTAGNIQIDGYGWAGSTAQTYPDVAVNIYYAGDLSFVFQQVD